MPLTLPLATDAQLDAVKADVAALAARVAALESVPTVPPQPPPPIVPPPPPPIDPPPSGGWVAVAAAKVPIVGNVTRGVAVAVGKVRSLGQVRVGGALAQGDNPVINDGWLRWFLLSAADVPPGVIEVNEAPETGAPLAPSLPAASITAAGQPATFGAPPFGYARRGPVVTEAAYRAQIPGGPQVVAREAAWANGKSSTVVRFENSGVTPGRPLTTLTYDCTIVRGAETKSYAAVAHAPNTRWVRRLGDSPVFASIVPVVGGTRWQHFAQTGLLENAAPYDPLSLAPLDALPDAPFAVSPGGDPVNGTGFNGAIGHMSRSQGSPGANADIGPEPDYYESGLCMESEDGDRLITVHADARLNMAAYFRSAATGGFFRMDEGADYTLPNLNAITGPNPVNQQWAPSHWGAGGSSIPYWLTGDLEYLETMIARQLYSWCSTYPSHPGDPANGSQLHRHPSVEEWPYTERGTGYTLQHRTQGWAVGNTCTLLAMMPEDDAQLRALTGWDKTMVRTLWTNVQAHHKTRYVDQTGPGKRWAADGPHGSATSGSTKSWMWAMLVNSLACGEDLGVLDANGKAVYRWNASTYIGAINHRYDNDGTLSIPDFMLCGMFTYVRYDTPKGGWYMSGYEEPWDPLVCGTGPVQTFGELYKAPAQRYTSGGDSGNAPRPIDNPIAISIEILPNADGSLPPQATWGVRVRFRLTPGPLGDCFPNPANWDWYKWTDVIGATANDDWLILMFGVPIVIEQIETVNSGTGWIGKQPSGEPAKVPFPTGAVRLGWPHPADARNVGQLPTMAEPDYIGWFPHLFSHGVDHGIPGAAEALTWMRDYMARKSLALNPNHNVAPRTV